MTTPEVLFLRVSDFASSRDLSDETFATSFGRGYLLHFGDLGAIPVVTNLGKTAFAAPPEFASRTERGSEFIVFPIRLTGRTPYTDFISVGRTANNDVVINDGSVSGFHARIKTEVGADGRTAFFIQDAGSRNATYVGEERIPGPESNRFTPIGGSGTPVQLGNVELTFMLVPEFRRLLRGVRR